MSQEKKINDSEVPDLVDDNDIISLDNGESPPEEKTDQIRLDEKVGGLVGEESESGRDSALNSEEEDTGEMDVPAALGAESSYSSEFDDTGQDSVPQAEPEPSPTETVDEPLVSRRRRRLDRAVEHQFPEEESTPRQNDLPPWRQEPSSVGVEKTMIIADQGAEAKTQILGAEGEEKPVYPILVVMSGEDEGREIEIVPEHAVIGRGTDCDLVFPDITCSRRHAAITREGNSVFITDLNSGNGTFVNGKRIYKAELHHGDEIRIGSTVLRFQFPQSPPPQTEIKGRTLTSRQSPVPTTGFVGNLLANPRQRRLVLFGGGGVAGLILVLAIIKMFIPAKAVRPSMDEIRKQQELQARQDFEKHFAQMKELIKEKKWAEAMLEFQLAQKLRPGESFLVEYKAHIEKEQAAEQAVKEALLAVGESKCERVTELVSQVPKESVYYEKAISLLKECEEKTINNMVEQGRKLMEEKKYAQAALLFEEVLKKSPAREEALPLKTEAERLLAAENASKTRTTSRPAKKKTETKPKKQFSARVLAFYREGDLTKALEVAENEGTSQQVGTLKKIKSLLEQARQMVRSQAEAVKAIEKLEQLRQLDQAFADGQGKIAQEVRELLAKCYFLQGADAKLSKKYPEAYQAFRMAEKYGNQMASKNLEDLKKIAKRLYEEAYIIKSSNPEQAISKLEVVVKIIPPDDPYYTKGQKLLSTLRNPGTAAQENDGEF